MKRLVAALLLGLTGLLPLATEAQTAPAVPASPPAGLQGPELRTWLRANWYEGKHQTLGYNNARGRMYNYVDNYDNKVTCVYSGYTRDVPFNATSTNPAVFPSTLMNCEHSIPQSWFDEREEQKSDIHHLYPSYSQWNSDRGSDPFADIPDATTTGWLRGTTKLTSIPTSNIDEYSEDGPGRFEPREDHKGNLARTAFYFYTMHTDAGIFDAGKNVITALADLQTLYKWHLADPVDARELERNRRAAAAQGNYNPYINDPSLAARAWGLTPAGPVIAFSTATGTIGEGNTGTSTYTATLSVSPAPTAALTVQVALAAAGATATSGTDFSFTSPQTVTFAAGQTTATTTVTILGDTQPEADETLALTLQNPGTGASVGGPVSQVITITNDDGTPPTVRFAQASGTIAEGNTGTQTYTVAVDFVGALPAGGFSVPVLVEASSTAGATDYTLSATSLTFSGSTTQQTLTVTVSGDLLSESNETLRLRLGTPVNTNNAITEQVLLGTPASHVLTISNDDQAPVGAACANLYFSEYVESGPNAGNTKVVEIYNPTASAIDLADFRVELYAAGSTAVSATANLTGTLAPGDVYVIINTNPTAGTPAAEAADLQSGVGFFSGAQSLALFDGTDTLDIIGRVGKTPPGGSSTGWDLPGGGSTRDNTLVRKPTVGQGSTRWTSTEGAASWEAVGANVFTGVGRHVSTACATGTATRAGALLRTGLEVYPNPAAETLNLRLPGLTGTQPATVELLDGLGRVVRQRAATLSATSAAQLDLRGLPAGIYAVRVRTASGQYVARAVVK